MRQRERESERERERDIEIDRSTAYIYMYTYMHRSNLESSWFKSVLIANRLHIDCLYMYILHMYTLGG